MIFDPSINFAIVDFPEDIGPIIKIIFSIFVKVKLSIKMYVA